MFSIPGAVSLRRFWQSARRGRLNTGVEEASAALLGARARARASPAAARLPAAGAARRAFRNLRRSGASVSCAQHGAELRFGRAAAARSTSPAIASPALASRAATRRSRDDESVVLAVPAPVAGAPRSRPHRAARVPRHRQRALPHRGSRARRRCFVGIVGGMAEWVFRKREVLSVTVSAADRLVDTPAEELSLRLWRDAAKAYDLPAEPVPPWQIVKERRATFAATPAQLRRRPHQATRWSNLTLAGDWTDTGLPATIEGAIRSGFAAAERLLAPSLRGRGKALERQRRACQGGGRSAATAFSRVAIAMSDTLMPRYAAPDAEPRVVALDEGVQAATAALLALQREDGHWCFELEADATIPAEYILLQHFLDEIDAEVRGGARALSALDPGRAWRLAAVPWRRPRPLRQHQGLFRAEGGGRFAGRAAHGAGARRRSSRAAAPRAAMSSRASSSRCSARCRGAPCR